MAKRVCVVAGLGPGNGAAFARRFASEGYAVALLARTTGLGEELASSLPDARAYACDVSDAGSVARAFEAIRRDLGDPEVLVYNAGSGVWGSFEEATAADFESAWRVNALGAFLAAKQVIPAMKRAGRGSIVFVGATASRKAGARSASFSSAKGAQRSLAESMARALWPKGIHVALIVVDGVVDLPRTRERMPDKPDSFFIQPDDVAEIGFRLTQQRPSAWSFEVEARPFAETW
ncbi:MAG TPA: SDR family NAD(P)-dependent oxidoreductase [Myxococcales bacterium]|nr:SDR family NAD(P)-dependent oxidoreductase [Myxococcales bacterium]